MELIMMIMTINHENHLVLNPSTITEGVNLFFPPERTGAFFDFRKLRVSEFPAHS